jgi:hypothetical protein
VEDVVVHPPKAALSVKQVVHVLSPSASRWQPQLGDAKVFALGRQQHCSHIASIAAIGPRPRQGRHIDRNSDLASSLPI